MRRCMAVMVLSTVALLFAWGATAQTGKGAEQIKLAGGTQGQVPFPHHRHQKALGDDCQACHALFAQEPGSIAKAKTEGKLLPKQIMNTHCIHCHRDRKQAGQTSGPISCAKCHVKE
ncbi:MAG: cytochrome c3 family protein [Desulfatitalea sp.]|nr:cytochrome c3 family protein [Desulfatitalea sp.]